MEEKRIPSFIADPYDETTFEEWISRCAPEAQSVQRLPQKLKETTVEEDLATRGGTTHA